MKIGLLIQWYGPEPGVHRAARCSIRQAAAGAVAVGYILAVVLSLSRGQLIALAASGAVMVGFVFTNRATSRGGALVTGAAAGGIAAFYLLQSYFAFTVTAQLVVMPSVVVKPADRYPSQFMAVRRTCYRDLLPDDDSDFATPLDSSGTEVTLGRRLPLASLAFAFTVASLGMANGVIHAVRGKRIAT